MFCHGLGIIALQSCILSLIVESHSPFGFVSSHDVMIGWRIYLLLLLMGLRYTAIYYFIGCLRFG